MSKATNGERVEYTYEEGTDRLLKYGEESFACDEIGNPTTFRDMTAVWAIDFLYGSDGVSEDYTHTDNSIPFGGRQG